MRNRRSIVGWVSSCSLLAALVAPPLSEAASNALLNRFRPALYFEDDGPGGRRVDYPSLYNDDSDIENNFLAPELASGANCYGLVHEQRDANGKICWVVQYHYYFARNWSSASPPFGCYTHEHDWEWIIVVVGSVGGVAEPYCACFSAHTAGNPDLFGRAGAVRLFPEIAGGSVWKAEWDGNPDQAPRVSLGWDEHVEATCLASGNEFDGSPWQARGTTPWTHYPILSFVVAEGSCAETSVFFYGDPALEPLCIGRSERAECGDGTNPPWLRTGLGGLGPLPSDFALPDDWDQNASTELPAIRVGPECLIPRPNPTTGELRLVVSGGARPDRIDLLDLTGRLVARFEGAHLDPDPQGIRINLWNLPAGRFWLRLHTVNEGEEVHGVVILR